MILAEGLEAKELRGALQAVGAHMPYHPMDDNASLDMSDVAIARASEVLARPKSSYEQEAELMEAVVSAANSVSGKGMMQHTEFCDAVVLGPDLGPSTKPCNCGKDDLDSKLKALDKFRGENAHT